MFTIRKHTVPNNISDIRLIDYCQLIFPNIPSRSGMKKAIKRGEILVDEKTARDGLWVQPSQKIRLIDLDNKPPKPLDLKLEIIFEDEHLAVINKPAGIEVSGNKFRTIQNALLSNISISNEPDALKWARPVHRLDRPTSGLLLIAKTANALMNLGRKLENREIQKTYRALVSGKIEPKRGEIHNQIANQHAITSYECIEYFPSIKTQWISVVNLHPHTGRTHQLRIHMADYGFPIVGEKQYGTGPVLKGKGLFLSAIGLSFIHPKTGKTLNIKIEQPAKFASFIAKEKLHWEQFNQNN